MRGRLRNDRGFALWIVGLGIAARSFLLAGTATPLLVAASYFMRHKGWRRQELLLSGDRGGELRRSGVKI